MTHCDLCQTIVDTSKHILDKIVARHWLNISTGHVTTREQTPALGLYAQKSGHTIRFGTVLLNLQGDVAVTYDYLPSVGSVVDNRIEVDNPEMLDWLRAQLTEMCDIYKAKGGLD